jgi:hypothetical protein
LPTPTGLLCEGKLKFPQESDMEDGKV